MTPSGAGRREGRRGGEESPEVRGNESQKSIDVASIGFSIFFKRAWMLEEPIPPFGLKDLFIWGLISQQSTVRSPATFQRVNPGVEHLRILGEEGGHRARSKMREAIHLPRKEPFWVIQPFNLSETCHAGGGHWQIPTKHKGVERLSEPSNCRIAHDDLCFYSGN